MAGKAAGHGPVIAFAPPIAAAVGSSSTDDADDDLKRELAFYNQALSAVKDAQQRMEAMGVPHRRPNDYFAEMVKSDAHMTKIKARLIRQQQDISAAEERRKQRAGKKFGKQTQREKLVARAQQRKAELVREKREAAVAAQKQAASEVCSPLMAALISRDGRRFPPR